MKKIFLYSIALAAVFLFGCQGCRKKNLPPLKETYLQTDKNPFGGYVAFNQLRVILGQSGINTSFMPLESEWRIIPQENDSARILYFLIAKDLRLNFHEINTLLGFAAAGNTLFIASDYIQPELLKALHTRQQREEESEAESAGMMDTAFITALSSDTPLPKFSYFYYPFFNSIQFERRTGLPLGYNQNNTANFIRLNPGKGKVFLHVAPRAFSNYFLLTGNNLDYFRYVVETIGFDGDYVFWDEYYKLTPEERKLLRDESENFSTMRVINRHPPLRWAFWIVVASLALFLISAFKRRQRMIPVAPPRKNATVGFTEMIGRLYLQQKDNKNIAEKQITYFYDKIRRHYFIQIPESGESFAKALAAKSGLEITAIKDLLGMIGQMQKAEVVSDEELMDLNERINLFNKMRK